MPGHVPASLRRGRCKVLQLKGVGYVEAGKVRDQVVWMVTRESEF